MLPPPCGLITLTTGLGVGAAGVAWMKGAIKSEFRRADVVDICHDVASRDAARELLGAAVGRFPKGTIHVVACDDGTVPEAPYAAAVADGCYWLAPDQDFLAGLTGDRVERRELRPGAMDVATEVAGQSVPYSEILATVAGRIAAGRYGFRSVGPKWVEA